MDTSNLASTLLHRGAEADLSLATVGPWRRSEEHTSELQSLTNLVCRLLREKEKPSRTLGCPSRAARLRCQPPCPADRHRAGPRQQRERRHRRPSATRTHTPIPPWCRKRRRT